MFDQDECIFASVIYRLARKLGGENHGPLHLLPRLLTIDGIEFESHMLVGRQSVALVPLRPFRNSYYTILIEECGVVTVGPV